MPEEKPETNSSDANNSSNPPRTEYRDWREQRREWRQQRREERHRDPLRGLFWGLALILIGVMFFAHQQGWVHGDQWWQYLLIGIGAIFIINSLFHFRNPDWRHSGYGQFIPGVVLVFVGIAFLLDFSQWWPIVLIGVGVVILISFAFRRG